MQKTDAWHQVKCLLVSQLNKMMNNGKNLRLEMRLEACLVILTSRRALGKST